MAERRLLSESEADTRSRAAASRFLNWVKFESRIFESASDPGPNPGLGVVDGHLPEVLWGGYRCLDQNPWREANPETIFNPTGLPEIHFSYPRILSRTDPLMDFAVAIHHTDWVFGSYGIPEPRAELPAAKPSSLDLILVPGVVFDERGGRIGMGAGYYDRYLARAPGALRVGFAFDFQVRKESIPQAPWDAKMDLIVTEKRLIVTQARD